jgi:uncharacterized protein (DUF488 family)
MSATAAPASERPIADLTRSLFGEPLSLDQVFEIMQDVTLTEPSATESVAAPQTSVATETVWVGSIGYERHRHATEFSALLRNAHVERVIDVRELPISRRRGYAKTALSESLAQEGIEYVHIRGLGNPKPFRDLYKSGRVREGRAAYEHHLLTERIDELHQLVPLLKERRSALLCVEHDPAVCHRAVILDALRNELRLELDVIEVG